MLSFLGKKGKENKVLLLARKKKDISSCIRLRGGGEKGAVRRSRKKGGVRMRFETKYLHAGCHEIRTVSILSPARIMSREEGRSLYHTQGGIEKGPE